MAFVDIESDDFIKALRLLHSRTPESSDELKRLLDSYYLKQTNIETRKSSKDFTNVFTAIQSLNQDISKNEAERKTRTSEEDSEATDIEDNENADSGEFGNDLGLACVVCKQIDITNTNQLFECQDCLCLYHQDCHKPPITKKDINDPRLVWYCSKCNKSMKKVGKPLTTSATTGKISVTKAPALASSVNPGSSTAVYSTNYQNVSLKDATIVKPQGNFMKQMSETDKSNQPSFKRTQGKFGSFSQSYTANTKAPNLPLSSTNRAPTSTSLPANKSKLQTQSSSSTSSFPATNVMPSLDKRFSNLKKSKLTKYN